MTLRRDISTSTHVHAPLVLKLEGLVDLTAPSCPLQQPCLVRRIFLPRAVQPSMQQLCDGGFCFFFFFSLHAFSLRLSLFLFLRPWPLTRPQNTPSSGRGGDICHAAIIPAVSCFPDGTTRAKIPISLHREGRWSFLGVAVGYTIAQYLSYCRRRFIILFFF